jgi:hypothetical protein
MQRIPKFVPGSGPFSDSHPFWSEFTLVPYDTPVTVWRTPPGSAPGTLQAALNAAAVGGAGSMGWMGYVHAPPVHVSAPGEAFPDLCTCCLQASKGTFAPVIGIPVQTGIPAQPQQQQQQQARGNVGGGGGYMPGYYPPYYSPTDTLLTYTLVSYTMTDLYCSSNDNLDRECDLQMASGLEAWPALCMHRLDLRHEILCHIEVLAQPCRDSL